MTFDASALVVSYLLFVLARYEGGIAAEVVRGAAAVTLGAVLLQWLAGSVLRVYQGRATVASLEETLLLALTTAGTGVVVSVANAFPVTPPLSRAVPLGATFMALFLMVLARAAWRTHLLRSGVVLAEDAALTLVFGAGEAGRQLVHSMQRSPEAELRPVGLLDDDPWKRHLRVHGVSVLGGRGDLASVSGRTGAEVLVIAVPSADAALIRDLSASAREAGLAVKVVPAVQELLNAEKVSIRDVRDIDVADLLGRGVIETDIAAIADYVTGKRVLVTGAGGSIGSELCRQLHEFGPSELIMLDRDESALHGVQLSIHGRALLDSPDVVLADIRDQNALDQIFLDRRPQVVFHAAALKHLPMLEQYPAEGWKTNVLGTANVLRAASMVEVERFVNVSTDKAADPTSVLGYSKRVAERLTAHVASTVRGSYMSVRFGNVLGSRGSVLTSFTAQIAAGGPVTVTHPDVTRYFMTVQEAVQLVIQAAAIGEDGEVLILDMGEPVSILSVAQQLIDQSGQDIEIVFTGLRDGEKLHERLYSDGESGSRPKHPLVTHVSVPALGLARVRTAEADLEPDVMLKQLAHLADADDAGLSDEYEPLPRHWSGMEV